MTMCQSLCNPLSAPVIWAAEGAFLRKALDFRQRGGKVVLDLGNLQKGLATVA
jgi:hypothetical protein